jgi:DNA-binding NarL/FixJ family response regulator
VRTVSTHLSNSYGKLGIGGAGARMRLGNMIRDAGLLE